MKEKLENLSRGQLISIIRNIQNELKKDKKLKKLNITRIKDEYFFEYYWDDVNCEVKD
jgi:hypothetical protein